MRQAAHKKVPGVTRIRGGPIVIAIETCVNEPSFAFTFVLCTADFCSTVFMPTSTMKNRVRLLAGHYKQFAEKRGHVSARPRKFRKAR